MPIEVGIWPINGARQKAAFSALQSESRLQHLSDQDIAVLS